MDKQSRTVRAKIPSYSELMFARMYADVCCTGILPYDEGIR